MPADGAGTVSGLKPLERMGGVVLPKGLGNLANLGGMVKQAMEMKAKIEEMKEQLGALSAEAASGGGMVSVQMSGKFELLRVSIDPEIVNPEEVEMLETLVQAAVNECVHKVQELIQAKMREITGGLDIPGIT